MDLINPNKIIIPGLDDHLIDTESLGETKMEVVMRSPEETVLNMLRERFKQGCVVEATDVNKPILDMEQGLTGLSFYWPRGKKPKAKKDGPTKASK